MRWLLVFLVGCVVHDHAQTLARWQSSGNDSYEVGCVSAAPHIRKTGRDGIGVSLQLKSHGDCDVVIGKSILTISGERTEVNAGQHVPMTGHSLLYVWLPMRFDNLAAWNDQSHTAALVIELTANGEGGGLRIDMQQLDGDGHNAVGIAELDAPVPFENGDPQRYLRSDDPDYDTVLMLGMPYFLWGHGREHASIASRETGIDLHFEHTKSGENDEANWGLTAGLAIGQWGPRRGTDVLGPLSLEVDYRWTFVDVGIGPAVYTERAEVGVQGSIRIPFGLLRVRYMATSGIEVLAGFQVPLFPVIASRSR